MFDLGLYEALDGMEALLTMAMLVAMLYFAFAYARRRGGWWPRIFGGTAVGWLALLGAAAVVTPLNPSGVSSFLIPHLPGTVEAWFLLGGILWFLIGLLELTCGIALIIGGWREGQRKRAKHR